MKKSEIVEYLSPIIGDIFDVSPLAGGANNQGFKVSSNSDKYFVKVFSTEQSSSKYKLNNEFNFNLHLSKSGVHGISTPLEKDDEKLLALYSFIAGEKITSCKAGHVKQMLTFLKAINEPHIISTGSHLNKASDYPSTLAGFIVLVENRLTKLDTLNSKDPIDGECKAFIDVIKNHLHRLKVNTPNIDWKMELPANVLSPSDFGFHNAIETEQGVSFIDFEYAGFDTAWKLLADLFCQPQVPVKISYINQFMNNRLFSFLHSHPDEFSVVFELTKYKWCLIMLNEFNVEIQKRRIFSWNGSCIDKSKSVDERLSSKKNEQLKKSKLYYKSIPNDVLQLRDLITQLHKN